MLTKRQFRQVVLITTLTIIGPLALLKMNARKGFIDSDDRKNLAGTAALQVL